MTELDLGLSFTIVARVTLGLVFAPSGARKLRDLRSFTRGLRDYGLLPARLTMPVARLIAVAETLLGLCLLAGVAVTLAGAAVAFLLACFIVGMGVNLRRGRNIDCNCFGLGATQNIGPAALARNAALLVVAIALAALGLARGDAWWWSPGLAGVGEPDAIGAAVPLAILITTVVLLVYLLEWGIETRHQGRTAIRSMGGVS